MIIDDLLTEEVVDFITSETSDCKFVLAPDREDKNAKKYNSEILEGSEIIVEKYGNRNEGLDLIINNYKKDILKLTNANHVSVDENDDEEHGYLIHALKSNIGEKETIYHFVKAAYSPEYSYVAYAKIHKKFNPQNNIPMDDILTWPVVIRDNICSD